MSYSLDGYVVPPDDYVSKTFDQETVIVDLEGGEYFGLEKVGARFWALVELGSGLRPAFRTLLDEFDVDEKTLESDLLELVGELVDHGLLKYSDHHPDAV